MKTVPFLSTPPTFVVRAVVSITILITAISHASVLSAQEPDKTLSPYFIIKSSGERAIEAFPLTSTSADVKIAGVIADVHVTQVYRNTGTTPIEAVYVFPGSTRAAVYGMKMTIGERVRIAQIQEKKEAKATYEKAKSEGKSASLLEQHRPNVFQMNIANVLPGDDIKVELSYTELLVPTDGIYEFVYPTVVGPRYSNQIAATAPAEDQWVANPYLHAGEKSPYTTSLSLAIDGAVAIQELTSPSHNIVTDFKTPTKAEIRFASGEEYRGNKDFIVKYRLQGGTIQTGMMLSESNGEKFFLLMAQPPKRIERSAVPPRNYIFVVDVSGSMVGFPLTTTKSLMKELARGMSHQDTFNVILFAGAAETLFQKPMQATPDNITQALSLIDDQNGGGGTELLPALKEAFSLAAPEGVANSIVLVTDGYVNVQRQALELVGGSLNRSSLFTFGIGSAVDRHLIDALARSGQGESFVATNPVEATSIARKFREYIETPVLTNIEVAFNGMNVSEVEPKSFPDMYADRPLIVFGKYSGSVGGSVKVTGKNGKANFLQEVQIDDRVINQDASALRYLWARAKVARLSDYATLAPSGETTAAVTQLGLRYSILTPYTSFVAVDEVVRNPVGGSTTVTQPLPMPEGVSNSAVGMFGEIGTSPEPETYALLGVLGLLLLCAAAHSSGRSFLIGK